MKSKHLNDKSSPDYVVTVGVDDGHYGIKLAIEPGVVRELAGVTFDPNKIVCVYMASRVARSQVATRMDGDEQNLYSVERNGRKSDYTVIGDEHVSIKVEDTRSQEFALSDGLLVMVHHALLRAGLGGRKVRIATGLPYNRYFLARNVKNEQLISQKSQHLLVNKPTNLNPGVALAQIVEHQVMPEGVAGFHDQLTDDQGNINDDFYEKIQLAPIGFLDVGGNTTDVAVINVGGQTIDDTRSFTMEAGGLHVEEDVTPLLKEQFKMPAGYEIPRKLLERAVRTGLFRGRGAEHNVENLINPVRENHAARISNEISAKWQGAFDLDAVYLIGGGSILLGDQLAQAMATSDCPTVRVEAPQFANARGFVKKMLYL